MGKWQFRRSKKILPGVRLNFSKKGIGISAGVPGARVSLSPDKKRLTFSQSIPGTGFRKQDSISISKLMSGNQDSQYHKKSKYKELFKDSEFNNIYESIKSPTYKIIKKATISSWLLFVVGAFLPVSPDSEFYGGSMAILMLVAAILLPVYFTMRGRLLLNAKKTFLDKVSKAAKDEAKKIDFDNSLFGTGPKNREERDFLIQHYERTCELIKIISSKSSDNQLASEIEVESGEAVFFKCAGALTDYDAIEVSDTGFVYITNKKVIFMGLRKVQEWEFSRMPVPLPDDEKQVAVFQVSNRKTVTGVKTSRDEWVVFKANLLQAFAVYKYPERASIEFPETLEKLRALNL